jgi:hypothetical protein
MGFKIECARLRFLGRLLGVAMMIMTNLRAEEE